MTPPTSSHAFWRRSAWRFHRGCAAAGYKSSGYEKVSILRELLDGVIDIYMPDLKYAEAGVARKAERRAQLSGSQPGRRG